jgi:hypothetical protein
VNHQLRGFFVTLWLACDICESRPLLASQLSSSSTAGAACAGVPIIRVEAIKTANNEGAKKGGVEQMRIARAY